MKIHWFVWAMEILEMYVCTRVLYCIRSLGSIVDEYSCYFQMSFEWSVKMENETEIHPLESSLDDKENMSFLRISIEDKGRTYQCIANNSVGIGTMCSIEITGNI